jgi:CYTH domain-containing protein
MAAEIERRFMVSGEGWKPLASRVDYLRDGLIGRFGGGKVRVRQTADKAWLAVKGPRTGIRRQEYEYEIPIPDAAEMLRTLCTGPIVEKLRHHVPHAGHIWSVDVHLGELAGPTLAEIELSSEAERFRPPPWLGREVTHDPLFRKQALLARFASPPPAAERVDA